MVALLAEQCMMEQDYARAIQFLQEVETLGSFNKAPELRTITLVRQSVGSQTTLTFLEDLWLELRWPKTYNSTAEVQSLVRFGSCA